MGWFKDLAIKSQTLGNKKLMRLCIVTHNVLKGDGQGRVNYEIVQEALARGHQLILVATHIDPLLKEQQSIQWIPISTGQWPTQLVKNAVFSYKSSAWLRQHQNEYDFLLTNGSITPTAADANSVHFVHRAWLRSSYHISKQRRDVYGAYQWLYSFLNAHWEYRTLYQSKIIVAVSQLVKNDLIQSNIPAERIHVIHNGVDIEEFSPGRAERTLLKVPEDVPLALFVGDIRSSRKNLDTVLQALTKVPELHLAIAGTVKDSPYPQMASKLNLMNRVYFLDFRKDVSDLMKAADFFVFPSRYEPCGLVLLEAMASGLPIITATTAGGSELVKPECGFIMSDSESVSTLTEAMQKLTNSSELRQKMGFAAHSIAQNHTWKRMAGSYLDIFENFIQN